MKEKIQIESYHYCEWNDDPPINIKCPYLNNINHCSLYDINLNNYYATDSCSGRDEFCVERCGQCKSEN